jgi:alkaline phosphatase D
MSSLSTSVRVVCLSALVLGLGSARAEGQTSRASARPVITHGVASGDVSASTALVWARANKPARMHVQVSRSPRFAARARERTAFATSSSDFTAKVRLTRLRPNTRYFYRVWFTGRKRASSKLVGSLRTAPAASASAPVSFVTSGDLGGQSYCRNVDQRGYGILAQMARLAPGGFIAKGDMIYADYECPSAGPPGWQNVPGRFFSVANPAIDWLKPDRVRRSYLAHWRYNRADTQFRRLLRTTPLYSLWDDHEVLNDFGAAWPQYPPDSNRQGYRNLVRQGRRAFFLYGLIDGGRIYRSFRWGKDVELFVLDGRSYRSLNVLADTAENAKTMLGPAQRQWLLERLRNSTATWKLVVTSAPLSIASGPDDARDGWANGHSFDLPTYTGFERELRVLLAELDRANVHNMVFLAGDVHHARELRYNRDYDGDGERLLFHELITGPLAAERNLPRTLDPTFGPIQLYAEGGIFNFGYVRVGVAADGRAHLSADVRDETGAVRPGSALDLAPE